MIIVAIHSLAYHLNSFHDLVGNCHCIGIILHVLNIHYIRHYYSRHYYIHFDTYHLDYCDFHD